jgi:hypothetical protein
MSHDLAALAEWLRTIRFDPIPVKELAEGKYRLDWPKGEKPEFAGIHAFWWGQGRHHLWRTIQNRTLEFHGVGGENGKLELLALTKDHFTEFDGRVPLYIGKSASIAPRVGQHLLPHTERTVDLYQGAVKSKRKTSACQVRDRMDRLLHLEADTRKLILENLALSCGKRAVDPIVPNLF